MQETMDNGYLGIRVSKSNNINDANAKSDDDDDKHQVTKVGIEHESKSCKQPKQEGDVLSFVLQRLHPALPLVHGGGEVDRSEVSMCPAYTEGLRGLC